jgi:hypothetical protein
MKTYKRTVFNLIKGIVLVPFSGLLAYIVARIFLPHEIGVVAGVVVAVFLLYIAVFSENIRFELDSDGTFRFYKKGALKHTFDLTQSSIGYHRRTEWGLLGNNDISLKILDSEGRETVVDAGPLGTRQFETMFEAMEQHTQTDVEVLKATKK